MVRRNDSPPKRGANMPKRVLGVIVTGTIVYFGGHTVLEAMRPVHVRPSHHLTAPSATPSSRSSSPSAKSSVSALPQSYLIHVEAKDQYPQLPNGCEVTSLAMLLTAVGHPVSKMTLAAKMPVDPTPLQLTSYTGSNGQVVHKVQYWGNPNVGFVGNVYKAGYGYGIYNGPMTKFLNHLLPGRAEDLTGKPWKDILRHVATGIPVEVWTTTTFQPTTNWVTWQSPEGPVKATPLEHAVLVVGYSPGYLYVNNPLNGQAAQKVPAAPFIQAWNQLGDQAITVSASH